MFIFSKKKILKNLLVLVLMVLALSNSHASQESFLEGTPLKVRVSAPSHKTLPEGFEESISFSGAAFYFYFHLGVAAHLQETYDLSKACFLGASSGCFPAFLLAANISIKEIIEIWMPEVCSLLQDKPTGVYGNFEEAITKVCLKYMPTDSYKITNGRVFMSLTPARLRCPYNKRTATFTSNEHLINTAFASCQIPFINNPRFFYYLNGKKYLDGAFTDYQPVIDATNTIKVSPYMWSKGWFTFLGSLYGSVSPEHNLKIYRDGYKHAAANPDHWLGLEKFRKKPLISRL